jgi:hypothetical protein
MMEGAGGLVNMGHPAPTVARRSKSDAKSTKKSRGVAAALSF